MTNMIERTLYKLAVQLPGRVSRPGDDSYATAIGIWARPLGRMPRAIVNCRTVADVQAAIRASREADLPLSVRGGGHDWAGRALCEGIVIDLRGMNQAAAYAENNTATISGGALASDVVAAAAPFDLVAVTGTVGAVGMAGLTLGGGYGPLIGRFGLALDNLVAAEVALADGRVVIAQQDNEPELYWALRGGGGNFGVVTTMHHRLHKVPSVRTGMLVYPFSEARTVIEGLAEITATAAEELSVQLVLACGVDGATMVLVVPTWCGSPEHGEAQVAPLLKLGTPLAGSIEPMSYENALTLFDGFVVNGQRAFMETSWLPALDGRVIDVLVEAMATAASPGCAIITHEFKGAASRVPVEATAFGLRHDHVMMEILATFVDQGDEMEEQRHRHWTRTARQALAPMAFPGGYPNVLAPGETDRAAKSFGSNAERLIEAKRHYDPDNVFNSAIPLPGDRAVARGH
jgi:FAD/FMN-containing dehydrogenase